MLEVGFRAVDRGSLFCRDHELPRIISRQPIIMYFMICTRSGKTNVHGAAALSRRVSYSLVFQSFFWNDGSPCDSRSNSSIVTASGNLGVTLTLNGIGRLFSLRGHVSETIPLRAISSLYVHDETIFHASVDVDREWLSLGVLCRLNVHRPEDHSDVDEQRVVGDVPANANPPTKTVRKVPFFLGISRPRSDPTFLVQMTCGIEACRVCSVDLGISVEVPNVCDDNRSGGDEVTFIPVILRLDGIRDRFPSQASLRTWMEQCGSPTGSCSGG